MMKKKLGRNLIGLGTYPYNYINITNGPDSAKSFHMRASHMQLHAPYIGHLCMTHLLYMPFIGCTIYVYVIVNKAVKKRMHKIACIHILGRLYEYQSRSMHYAWIKIELESSHIYSQRNLKWHIEFSHLS